MIAVRAPVERPPLQKTLGPKPCAAAGTAKATINVVATKLAKRTKRVRFMLLIFLLFLGDLPRVASTGHLRPGGGASI